MRPASRASPLLRPTAAGSSCTSTSSSLRGKPRRLLEVDPPPRFARGSQTSSFVTSQKGDHRGGRGERGAGEGEREWGSVSGPFSRLLRLLRVLRVLRGDLPSGM